METYCVSCKKDTGHEDSRVRKTKKNIIRLERILCQNYI